MKTVKMRLNDKPFFQIKNGEKRVEVRLFDEKRKLLCVGDFLLFTHRESGEALLTEIVGLHTYPTFSEWAKDEKIFPQCGFGKKSGEEAIQEMYTYYSPSEEALYGVLAIELKVWKEEKK
ncbi:MAG: ASCH domain-containing protein [Clostridia bacterium]|nr:ASCH domain-containing protein [Clostridia bacterium]